MHSLVPGPIFKTLSNPTVDGPVPDIPAVWTVTKPIKIKRKETWITPLTSDLRILDYEPVLLVLRVHFFYTDGTRISECSKTDQNNS